MITIRLYITILGILSLLLGALPTVAQSKARNSEGTEFWLCFMRNFRDGQTQNRIGKQDQLRLQLFLTSSKDANARIMIDGLEYDQTVRINANTVVNIQLPSRAMLSSTQQTERLAVLVTADVPISVYGLNSRHQTTDTYMGLPKDALGTEYRAMAYEKLSQELLSQIAIIATEDGTEVKITPSTATQKNNPAGKTFSIRLRKGDVYVIPAKYEVTGKSDLTGTLMESNKPIAVFSGHQCAYVPISIEACNHLIEQLPPINSWGKHFYLGMLKQRSRYAYRVLASENNTRVFEDARLVAVLRAGQHHESSSVRTHIQLTADKPILVAQYSHGFKNGDSVGDPMMILVSPTQQFLKEYRFATPISGDWHHYINIVTPTGAITDIRLNGRRLDTTMFTRLGESRYSIGQISVPYGTHVLRGSEPLGLYSYGFGYGADAYDAYGNMGGQNFEEIVEQPDTLAPLADGRTEKDYFMVTFRDDRANDRGIKRVTTAENTAMDITMPKIDEGTPHVTAKVKPFSTTGAGRVTFSTEDVAGNTSLYTVCYMYDATVERFNYTITSGFNVACDAEPLWYAGLQATYIHSFHSPDLTTTGNVTGMTPFSTGQGTRLGAMLSGGRRVTGSLTVSGRLSFGSPGGVMTSPDTVKGQMLDTRTGKWEDYREGIQMQIMAPYLTLGAFAEITPMRAIYVMAGLHAGIPMGAAIKLERTIISPLYAEFQNGERQQAGTTNTLSSLSSIVFGGTLGVGFTYPITFRVSAVIETLYTTYFNSLVSDGMWSYDAISFNAGLRYRW